METSDHVDLRGPLTEGLLGTGADLLECEKVGPLLARIPAKGTKATAIGADVGIIDMPVNIIQDAATVSPGVGERRQFTNLEKVLRFEQEKGIGIAEPFPRPYLGSNGSQRTHRFTV
jgi:hypothetical protein